MSLVERAIGKIKRGGSSTSAGAGTAGTEAGAALGPLASEPAPPQAGLAVELPTAAPPRVLIDRDGLCAAGYLPEVTQNRQFADQYRRIKRPLTAAVKTDKEPAVGHARVILVTSALPGDGKTFTSINLALSLAREKDTSVVLVDADAARPQVSRIFGVDAEPGITNALVDPNVNVESLILQTDVEGLSILPAGERSDHANELFASKRMTEVITRILARDPRRIVLFDSSPLLAATESRVLAGLAGQILLVVRCGKTPQHAVLDALNHIGSENAVSLILNEARPSLAEGLSGYGTYGAYGHDA